MKDRYFNSEPLVIYHIQLIAFNNKPPFLVNGGLFVL